MDIQVASREDGSNESARVRDQIQVLLTTEDDRAVVPLEQAPEDAIVVGIIKHTGLSPDRNGDRDPGARGADGSFDDAARL